MTNQTQKIPIWGIIPAAGLSRRMGQPKQLLPYQGSSVLCNVAKNMLAGGVEGVIVVTRTELTGRLHLPNDDRVHVVINDDETTQMIDSIRCGLAEIERQRPNRDLGVWVMPGDMPHVAADACRSCIAAYLADPDRIVIATYKQKRGHPIIFPFALRGVIEELKDGLRELARAHPQRVLELDVGDPGVICDINTLKDYEGHSS